MSGCMKREGALGSMDRLAVSGEEMARYVLAMESRDRIWLPALSDRSFFFL